MVGNQYGFVPSQWLERLVQARVSGADGILDKGEPDSDEAKEQFREAFREANGSAKARNEHLVP